MNIITGYMGEPHVSSQQDRNKIIGIIGSASRILKGVGSEMAATVVSANIVEIADGAISCQGCIAEILRGTTEEMAIENGEQDKKRIDLIVARYTIDSGTAIEDMQLVVIKGTSASSNPVAPSYNTGNIADGNSPVDFPLYRVNIDGISITGVTKVMPVVNVPSMITDLQDSVSSIQTSIRNLQSRGDTPQGFISALESRATARDTQTNGMRVRKTLYSFGSLAFDSTGAIERIRNVSDSIPDGYTLVDVHMTKTGSYAAYCYTCEIIGSTSVHIQLFRPTFTSVTAVTPEIALLCVKNL